MGRISAADSESCTTTRPLHSSSTRGTTGLRFLSGLTLPTRRDTLPLLASSSSSSKRLGHTPTGSLGCDSATGGDCRRGASWPITGAGTATARSIVTSRGRRSVSPGVARCLFDYSCSSARVSCNRC